jgi:alpha-L-fucosidase
MKAVLFKSVLFKSLLFALWCGWLSQTAAQPIAATPSPADARMQWWRDARFGLFIHWGPVSLQGTEIGWSRGGERRGYGSTGTEVPVAVYDNLYRQFNPTNFNADQWVRIAQAAGMKYLVFTSRHHDGFSMFDTRADDYRITSPASPYGKDVVKQLADACHRAGLRFGLYYSQPNWRHPDAFSERHTHYLDFLKTQVRELLTGYGQVDILWFDGLGKTAADYDAVAMNKMIRELQPSIIINDRNGLPEDYDTPEQRVGGFQNTRPWESCITICNQWAWKPDDRMKSLSECLRTLILCAGGDGNLLFNVGPMPDGRIEPRQVKRLQEMGAWLKRYGRSIYGTRGGPFKPGAWGASTYAGNTVYLHVFRWPENGLVLPAIGRKILANKTLTGGKAVITQADSGITIQMPLKYEQAIDTLIRLDLDGPASGISPVAVPSPIKAAASNSYHNQEAYSADKAFDGDNGTRWATDDGTHQAWVSLDLGKPARFSGVTIREAYAGRVKRFEFQRQENGAWVTLFEGTTLGPEFTRQFPAVSAQQVRLNILEATEGPTIEEIQLTGKP